MSQPKPGLGQSVRLGLTYSQARALISQAKATAFRPSQSQNITSGTGLTLVPILQSPAICQKFGPLYNSDETVRRNYSIFCMITLGEASVSSDPGKGYTAANAETQS